MLHLVHFIRKLFLRFYRATLCCRRVSVRPSVCHKPALYQTAKHRIITQPTPIPCGIAGNLLQKLQSVQNDAALLFTKTGRREHITPVLRKLHWLPVRQRIDFKLAVLVYKVLHGQLPQYLAEDCLLWTDIGRRSLRSADALTCATRRTRTRLVDRRFSVAGPCLWNSLPVILRDRDISLVQFKRLLKTLLFF